MTRMDCQEAGDLLTAFHDDELRGEERRSVADHLAGCKACADALRALEAQSERVRSIGTFAMPAGFETRMRDQLGVAESESMRIRRRALLAASHLAAACIGALLFYGATSRSDLLNATARDAMTAHARALMSGQTVQVASNDQHTVRPWFSTRVPFSPPVRDVLPSEFPLLGGRIDQLGDRPAAVVVYGRRRHKIDVFVQPRDATTVPLNLAVSRNGYGLKSWHSGDFAYLAISDLNAAELQELADALKSGPAASPR